MEDAAPRTPERPSQFKPSSPAVTPTTELARSPRVASASSHELSASVLTPKAREYFVVASKQQQQRLNAARERARALKVRRQWLPPPPPFGTPPSPRTRALIERAQSPAAGELVKFASTSSPVHGELVRLSVRANRAFKLGQYEQAVSIYTSALALCERESLPSAQRAVFWSNRACARVRLRHPKAGADALQDAERARAAALPSERAQYDLALLLVKAKDPRLSTDVSILRVHCLHAFFVQ